MVVQVAFRTQHEDVGLDTHPLQFLHGVLRGFRLQLVGSLQVGHIRQMDTHRITPQLPAQLSDGLHERCTLDVADGASHFGDDEIIIAFPEHPPLDLISDMRHHLNGLSQIVTMPLAVDDRLVDAACRDAVVTGGTDAGKPLVMSQVEIRFKAVLRHVALAVLIGIQRTRVDIDVGVEFLDGDLVTTCLQQFAN